MSLFKLFTPAAFLGGLLGGALPLQADDSHFQQMTVRIEDPRGDDYGAGEVKYPEDDLFRPSTFDLIEFRATPFSGGVLFEVDFAVSLRRPPEGRRVNEVTDLSDLQNHGLFLHNIDIYIDQDGLRGSGETQTIPGRNALIHTSSAWDKAVVLTPQPHPTRAILELLDKQLSKRILLPDTLKVRGRTVSVHVSTEELGEFSPQWGYVVVVTGADFVESFRAVDPNVQGFGRNIFTRSVRPSRSDLDFGGGEHNGLNTNIIDLLLPEGAVDQKEILQPDRLQGQWPTLQAVFPRGRPPVPSGRENAARPGVTSTAAVSPGAVPPSAEDAGERKLTGFVVDFDPKIVVINLGQNQGNRMGELGRVLDEQGATVVRFVVSKLLPDFAVGEIVEGDWNQLEEKLRVELTPETDNASGDPP